MTIIPFITRWGFESIPWPTFLDMAQHAGFRGIELGVEKSPKDTQDILHLLKQRNFHIILQHWETSDANFELHKKHYSTRLKELAQWQPLHINSHTGRDVFSVEQNRALIAIAADIAKETGITICHETHRSRFLYAAHRATDYLAMRPPLNLDISHWMVVAESYLEDQDISLKSIYPWVKQIHARIGHPQGPQVLDLTSSESEKALSIHFEFWRNVINTNKNHLEVMPITFEMGPPPYMPSVPAGKSQHNWQFELNQQLFEKFYRYIDKMDGIRIQP